MAVYCAYCGRHTGEIQWSLSASPVPAPGRVAIRPGDPLYVVAENRGQAVVRVELELPPECGLVLMGAPVRSVQARRSQAFELRSPPTLEALRGVIHACSGDGPREQWWETTSRRIARLRLDGVQVRVERWVPGAATLLFPPGVRRQYLRVWNDSLQERQLDPLPPPGYSASVDGESLDLHRPVVPAGASLELALEPSTAGTGVRRAEWRTELDGHSVQLLRMPALPRSAGADLVVALDFGTRNTRVRVRWRRTLLPSRPAGTVDAVGDAGGKEQFPSQMVVHLRESRLLWGHAAASAIAENRLERGCEFAVVNLKTDLRTGANRYTEHNPAWTSAELLRRFLERILHAVDEYLSTVDPERPLSRGALKVRYVVCRPVLDANAGDEIGRAYEQTMLGALEACGVEPGQVSFVQEPVAAAIGIARHREEELLRLEDGTAVAVVDSGGGTTDVALARVRLNNGRVDLDLQGSYALHLEDGSFASGVLQRYGQRDREFGGNVLDWMLVNALEHNARQVLEADEGEAPNSVWRAPAAGVEERDRRAVTLLVTCRRMKERFATASTIYLEAPQGRSNPRGEQYPFPNRPDLRGVRLVHALYEEHLLRPVIWPLVDRLSEEIGAASSRGNGLRAAEVRRVFYVGGTCVDPFVRRHFGRPFPLAPAEADEGAQSPERIRERLHAVIDGAVWYDEDLFPSCPVDLKVRLGGEEHLLARAGGALTPLRVAPWRYFSLALGPGEELDAALVAAGGGLEEPLVVARGWYRGGDNGADGSLEVRVSRERGAEAWLRLEDTILPQWRVSLATDGGARV